MRVSIERQYGKYIPVCDGCGCVLDEHVYDTFDEARIAMKEEGWSTDKVNGEWQNYCPDCGE